MTRARTLPLLLCFLLALTACLPGGGAPSADEAADDEAGDEAGDDSTDADAEPAVEGDIVLEFPSWQTEEPGVREWWQELIAAYEEEHEDVTIQFEPIPFDQFVDTMLTRFSSDDAPEIVQLPSRNFAQFASQGFLEPLDDRLDGTDILDSWTPLQDEMMWNGEHQGLLLLGYGYLLFYNEQLLDEAGAEVPVTTDELMTTIAAFDDRDEAGFGFTTTSHPSVYTDMASFVVGTGGVLDTGSGFDVSSPSVAEGVDLYRTAAAASPAGVDSAQKRQLFINGDMAMMLDGPFVLATVEEQVSDELRDALKVAVPPFEVTPGGASNSLHVPAGLDDRTADAVWAFIELAASPEWQTRYAELYQVPPARIGAADDLELSQTDEFATMLEASTDAVSLFPESEDLRADFGQIEQRIIDAMTRLITSDEDAGPVLDELQGQLDARSS